MNWKKAIICTLGGLTATAALAFTATTMGIKPFKGLTNKVQAGSDDSYNVSLVMRADYDNTLKYFNYNSTQHYGEVTNVPIEYQLFWADGDSDHFAIFTGAKYLGFNTNSNVFVEYNDAQYVWQMTEQGIGYTQGEISKYLYYNNSATRCAPYKDKTTESGGLTSGYAFIYLYTTEQLEAWQQHCSGNFAYECLSKIAYTSATPTPTPTEEGSSLIFTKACGSTGRANDGVIWIINSDAAESTFDNTKGIHYGTSKVAVSYLKLNTSDINGTITKIVVNASGASQTSAKLNISIGGNAFGTERSLTSTATEYTFTGSASGEIEIAITQSSTKKALYCKSIIVTYQ